ncbi:MAG: hypothetical protein ACPGRD_05630 [Planktomarina sp.]
MRIFATLAMLTVLAGCQPTTPNDAASDASFAAARRAQAERDAALTGDDVAIPLQATVTTVDLDADPGLATTAPTTTAAARSGEISDEQNFDAVSGRETIESDAARLAQNRQQYSVISATDLPSRQGSVPNIVKYAIQTDNPIGVALYKRNGLSTQNRFLRNCQQYASSDLAQQDFLARGGPIRDRRGIDPDGDGFACQWDPRPFRAAVSN